MRTASAISFSLGPERTTPIAVVQPAEYYAIIGSRIVLDGRQSYSPDGEDLTYTWTVEETPVGSSRPSIEALDPQDASAVVFRPDVLGPYRISLTVSTPYRTSRPVVAVVYAQATKIPYLSRIEPDGKLFFRTILDTFGNQLEDKEFLPIYWSGLKQLGAADLLRLFQYEYGTSIRNIQPWFQRRWIRFPFELPIQSSGQVTLGHHQSGTEAFTQPSSVVVRGAIVDSTTMVLTTGTIGVTAVGQRVDVLAGPNSGTYYVESLLSSGNGFRVQALNPFPQPSSEVLETDTDLGGLSGATLVTSVGSNFVSVSVGDLVRITTGPNAGDYLVAGVPSSIQLTLARPLTSSMVNAAFSVFSIETASYRIPTRPLTDTVLIPQGTADFSKFERTEITGVGTLVNPYEILVESRHLFQGAIGKQIVVTSGQTRQLVSIASFNTSGTGYRVSSPLSTSLTSIGYRIPVVSSAKDRLLILDGRAYEMISATLDSNRVSTSLGGTGPVWVIQLKTADAPFNRTSLSWSVGSVFKSDATAVNFEELGITAGDVLYFEISRTDDGSKTRIPVGILGTRANKIAFSWGRSSTGQALDVDLLDAAQDLHIREVYVSGATGDVVIADLAAEMIQEIQTLAFRSEYWNLGLSESSTITIKGYSFTARAAAVRRNTHIPVDDDVASLPVLYEYITDVEGSVLEDGRYAYQAKDGNTVYLPRPPVELVEGQHFSVAGKRTLRGTSGATTAGSGIVSLAGADLLRRKVTPGDILELQSGPDIGSYVILEVLNSEEVRVLSLSGTVPATTSAALVYLLDKKVDGRFLTLTTPFTTVNPAPEVVWAHTALYDNSKYIEDNFGVKVGITKAQLDEFGTSQVSYLGAVRGLMHSWASNRSVESVKAGASILCGMPVAENKGVITSIEPTFSPTRGRIVIQATNDFLVPLGFESSYFYSTSTDLSLPEFVGIAKNPATGRTYEVGDVVEQDAVLSNGIIVQDWITAPGWWGSSIEGELQKYHSWEILADAQQMDSRDLALVSTFSRLAGPAHTLVTAKLVRFLSDTVTFTEDLVAETTVYLLDAPALSLEAQHAMDAYAESVSLRKIGIPTSGMRTLFEGKDLVTSDNSGVVVSARGGFTSTVTSIFPPFDDAIVTQGIQLVRPGDILFITSGPNRGRYEVDVVGSNTQLTLIQLGTALPPVSPAIADMSAATGQSFVIERPMRNPIVEGSDLNTSGTTASSFSGNFIWDGVAVGDSLIITDGADRGVYEILEVTNAGNLKVAEIFSGDTGASFYVRRENLRANPILSVTDGATVNTERRITTATGNPDLEGVRVDDELRVTTGAHAGHVFRVIDVVGTTEIWVDGQFTATEGSIHFTVVRPGDLAGGTDGDSDENLVVNFAYDPVVTTYYRPTTTLAGGPFTVTAFSDGAPATIDFSPTDMAAAVVTTAMFAEVQGGTNVGVYAVTGVAVSVVDVEVESWPDPSSVGDQVEFLVPGLAFDINGSTVTENPSPITDLETRGVRPGDQFVYSGTTYVVATVSTNVVTLTSSTGVVAVSQPGEFRRRTW